jgi:RNA polymerase sigma factor (sigma-70 family)
MISAMHGEPANDADSALLERWCEERSESAFATLVRKYERIVTGAILRRTGDLELARDVTQQVFTMLAAKGRLLIGHPSIAGWLYRSASHLAARGRRSEARRSARQLAATRTSSEPSGEHWALVEDALAQLGAKYREAIVLHFFQDLSYAEMAAALGVGEAAARKRVSRAVKSLGDLLRQHGLGSPTTVLAGAVAVQTACSTQAGLAAAAIASSASVSTPLAFIFPAIMSHLSSKIAVCVVALVAFPLAYQWNANASLREEFAHARQVPAAALGALPAEQRALPDTDLADMRAQLAAMQKARELAEARVAELSSFKDQSKNELVVSLGTVDSMARTVGATLKQLRAMNGKKQIHEPGSPEYLELEARMKEAVSGIPSTFQVMREIPRLEKSPEKAARFYSALLAETIGFDEEMRAQIEPPITEWVAQLQRDGLAFPQRPKEHPEAWDKRRIQAFGEMSRSLQPLVPADIAIQASMVSTFLTGLEEDATALFDLMLGKAP